MSTPQEIQDEITRFVEKWLKKEGREDQHGNQFWGELLPLLHKYFGVENVSFEIREQEHVKIPHATQARVMLTKKIDLFLPKVRVLIENKSRGVDLDKKREQSDGTNLTPFEQADRYNYALGGKKRAKTIIVFNFDEMRIHDVEQEGNRAKPICAFALQNLSENLASLRFLVDEESSPLAQQQKVSVQAAKRIGKLYDALLAQYGEITDPARKEKALQDLNKLCVRLVFCLYAENALIFEPKQFGNYLKNKCTPQNARTVLHELFVILNTPTNERFLSLEPELKAFPFVNGGLFENVEKDEIPPFNEEIYKILVDECSLGFNWKDISPTIFGALFESTLNPDSRRQGGMHYTSDFNIKKVINPLFLNDLKAEQKRLLARNDPNKFNALRNFQKKLGSLKFLDPACGSGNFLTETYMELRDLENEILAVISRGNIDLFGDSEEFSPILVRLEQFYGIEINDFAVSVARTALWIAEYQKLLDSRKILGDKTPEFLPLKTYTHIENANALRMDWNFVEENETGFIISNPPFVGSKKMDERQREDLMISTQNAKNIGNADYVCGWFFKACDLMNQKLQIKTAFVATNSLCQGEHVGLVWKPILEKGIHIDFAYRAFPWDSQTPDKKAQVHVVIVGFSKIHGQRQIFLENGQVIRAKNINAYLADAPSVFVEKRSKPLCNVAEMSMANKPIDDGNYLFTPEEKNAFLKKEPQAAPFFHQWMGAEEFIHGKKRFVLWVGDDNADFKKMPHVLERIKKVREFRQKSTAESTRKLADTPRRFHIENIPDSNYLLVPSVSTSRRKYIPIGFMPPEVFASNLNLIVPNATLFEFGILTSSLHNAWVNAVCGRLGNAHRYSVGIVYNNFVWADADEKQKAKIAELAQKVLNARAHFPQKTLADLYDPDLMPAELRKAHKDLDAAVLKLYKLKASAEESEIVSHLMRLYAEKTGQKWG